MGYVASTTTLYQSAVGDTQIIRSPDPSEAGAVSNPMERSGVSVTSGDRSIVLTNPEVQPPLRPKALSGTRRRPKAYRTPRRQSEKQGMCPTRAVKSTRGPLPSTVRLVVWCADLRARQGLLQTVLR